MTNTYHIYYSTQGLEKTRVQYASNSLTALNNFKKHLQMFGNGDESNFEIVEY